MTRYECTLSAGRPEIDAALVLLSKLGLTLDDLVAGSAANRPAVPTFAEFVPLLTEAVTAGTKRAYSSYWNTLVREWGDRHINEPSQLDLSRLAR